MTNADLDALDAILDAGALSGADSEAVRAVVAECRRLRERYEPEPGPWTQLDQRHWPSQRIAADLARSGWKIWRDEPGAHWVARGPETGQAGRDAADAALAKMR